MVRVVNMPLSARHSRPSWWISGRTRARAAVAPDKKFWWLGLDDAIPNPVQCWPGVAVTDHAVATSGDYLRHFMPSTSRRYGHILDPAHRLPRPQTIAVPFPSSRPVAPSPGCFPPPSASSA